MPVDPLSDTPRPSDAILHQNPFSNKQDIADPKKTVNPPSDDSTPTFPTPQVFNPTVSSASPAGVNNARSAVDAALAGAPYDPAAEGPIKALNAQPLPTDQPANQISAPAPPPVPPPLKLDSGVTIPTTATPVGKA